MQRVMARYELLTRCVPALWIAALWIPLQAIYPIAKVLAGKHTDVTLTVSISIAITLALGGGYFALWRRTKAQRDEIIRLRGRTSELEGELKATKATLGP